MKKIAFLFLFFTTVICSQTKGISYQALILNPIEQQLPGFNNDQAPLANERICLQFSIIDENTAAEYVETHTITTDAYGMVNLTIGFGEAAGGYAATFENIAWSSLQKSLKVALSTTASCTDFTEISNNPFTAVPFALFSVDAQNTRYMANAAANYIHTATSFQDADNIIDAQVKINEAAIANNTVAIVTNTAVVASKITTTAIVDDLTTGGSAVPLSAEQGKVLKNLVDTSVTIAVENKLTSTSATNALSANQGKVLKGLLDTNTSDITTNTSNISNINTLADGKVYLGDASGDAQEVTLTGDVTIDNLGETTIGANEVISSMITDGTILIGDLANDAVETIKIKDLNVTNDKLAAAIDAIKLADGSITNVELQYIGTLTSDAQTQINTLSSNGSTNATNIANNATAITTINTLADGEIYLGDSSGDAQEVTMAGDLTIDNLGITTIGTGKVTSAMILDDEIVDADVKTNAAIAGSKIDPDFGAQNVLTTGTLGAGATTVTTLTASGAVDLGIDAIQAGEISADAVTSAKILDDEIVNADVKTNAAIAGSKIDPDFGAQNVLTTGTLGAGATTVTALTASGAVDLGTDAIQAGEIAADAVTSAKILDDEIVNADVKTNAAIAGSKIDPDFGAQNVLTTGTLGAGATTVKALTASGAVDLGTDAIQAGEISADAVTSAKILDDEIVNADVKTNAAIAGSKIDPDFGAQNVLTTGTLGAGATTVTALTASGAVDLGTDAIQAGEIAAGAVATSEILNGTILNEDVDAAAAIAGTKIDPNFGAQNVVTTGTLGAGATTVAALTASGAVDLGTNAIQAGEIAAGAVATSEILNGTILNEDVDAAAAIVGTKIDPNFGAQNVITTGTLGAGATTVTALTASGAVDLGTDAIQAGEIAAGAVATSEILNGTILNEDVDAAAAIVGTKIDPNFGAQNVVTTGTLGAGATTVAALTASGAVDLGTDAIQAGEIAAGAVATSEILNGTILNEDVDAAAAIAGTKIDPNFGAQNVLTTGTLGAGATTVTTLTASGAVDLGIDAIQAGEISADAVTSAKILDDEIVNADVKTNAAIAGSKIDPNFGAQNVVTTGTLGAGATTVAALTASGAVDLGTDAIQAGEISADAVTTSEILNGTILNEDVDAAAAIAGTKIDPNFGAQNVVTTGTLGAGATTVAALTASGAVDLGTDAIQAGEIAAGAVATSEILNGTILNEDVDAAAAIAGTKIDPNFGAQNVVTTGTLGAGATTVTALTASGAVDLGTDAIQAGEIAAGAVATSEILNGTILNEDVKTNAAIAGSKIDPDFGAQNVLTTGTLGAGATTVTALTASGAVDLGTDAIQAGEIAAGAVTSAKILDDEIVNADVKTNAAIAGSKIDPDFGAQNVLTTGTLGAGATTVTALTASGAVDLGIDAIQAGEVAAGAVTTTEILDATIVDADVNVNAEIGINKLANGTTGQIMISDGTDNTFQSLSGDITIDNAGVTTIGTSKVVTRMIADANVTDVKIASAINAEKLADGSVTNTELQYINTLNANAQTQIDEKLALAGGVMSGDIDMGTQNIRNATSITTGNIIDSGSNKINTEDVDIVTINSISGRFRITGTNFKTINNNKVNQNSIIICTPASADLSNTTYISEVEAAEGSFTVTLEGTLNSLSTLDINFLIIN